MKDLIALLVVAFVVIFKAVNAKEKKKTAAPASSKSAAPAGEEIVQEETVQAAEATSKTVSEAERVAEKGTLEDMADTGKSEESVCEAPLKEGSDSSAPGSPEFILDPVNMIIYSEILSPDWEKE